MLAANLRGAGVIHSHGEDRAQNPAAIHRKSRNHVEENEPDVDGKEPEGERHTSLLHDVWIGPTAAETDEERQRGCDNDVHCGTCERDDDLFARFVRHPLQTREPANRQ